LTKLKQGYELFQTALEAYYSSLKKWQKAVSTLEQARQLFISADYDLILIKLKRAYTYSQEVEDVNIMSKARIYTALMLSKKVQEPLKGDRNKAKKFLDNAEIFLTHR